MGIFVVENGGCRWLAWLVEVTSGFTLIVCHESPVNPHYSSFFPTCYILSGHHCVDL